jgi:hypothetical protein
MSEMILPGVYIEVRPEGLISAGLITVGTVGIVGTARKGPVGHPILLASAGQARELFGGPDPFADPVNAGNPLTLMRALELAYANGAARVWAVRVGAGTPAEASLPLAGNAGAATAVLLKATSPGSWGNDIEVNVAPAPGPAVVGNFVISGVTPVPVAGYTLGHPVTVADPRTRIRVFRGGTQQTQVMAVESGTAASASGKVAINPANGALDFFNDAAAVPPVNETPGAGDRVTATFVVPQADARQVTLRLGPVTETYVAADGRHLAQLLNPVNNAGGSALVRGDIGAGTTPAAVPDAFTPAGTWRLFASSTPGTDGANAGGPVYKAGLELLLGEDAHIIVAAGQGEDIADELLEHVQNASTDRMKRDRIGVLGSNQGAGAAAIAAHQVASDRLIFVGPGIQVMDVAVGKAEAQKVTLPGAYAAAIVAGMLSARAPHISLTNKVVAGIETVDPRLSPPELEQLVLARVLALEVRNGVRVVKGVTTDDGAFKQITTRRIVDYAKYGVRSAAQPFIGLLNNDRVRKAMKGAISGFLAGMVDDEMLVGYELDVTATREEEIRGIARVTMTVKPTFSIDYIKVTMFLG